MRYNKDTCTVELTATELCALAHRSGHLDARRPRRAADTENRKKGVLLRNTTILRGISYTVEGTADSVTEEDGAVSVILTKSAEKGMPQDCHARLRCYGHFVCEAQHLPRVRLVMRFENAKGTAPRETVRELSAAELREFYETLLSRVERFARLEILRREELIPSVGTVKFPYSAPRAGQTELAEATFRAIRKGQRLFAQAPTGIGKTMSVLYPAVKALGEGLCDRIFYLTAHAGVRREAYAAAGRLFAAGARIRTVVLYAKEQMCLRENGCRRDGASCCNPEDCPYAAGYYDRVDAAVDELLSRQNGFPRVILMEVAQRHRICPYELSLDLSEQCEIIICDYNYAFDPAVYLRRYFDESGERGQYVFLVDEAHNLPDRAREMYSATLYAAAFEALYARIDPTADGEMEKMLGGFILTLRRLATLCTEGHEKHEDGTESGYYLGRASLEHFHRAITDFRHHLTAFLRKNPAHPMADALTESDAALRRCALLAEFYDERFLTWIALDHGALSVQIYCLDPAGVLNACMARARAAVLFSATLTPLDYFADILGGGKRAVTLELPSPYDPSRLCVTVADGVSTRFEERSKSYKKIASLIAATVSAKAGNYMVYFPSYDYLQKVLDRFRTRYPGIQCVVQEKNMRVHEREAFLSQFKADEGVLRVGFCVLGGGFSEGVDLPGSRLIGVVIVGVGIPGLSNERNILRDYYENKCERGYDYAYTYPGMNRVLQAAGRVIRGEEDRGAVVLVDSRYAEEPYLHLYPQHWQGLLSAGDAVSLARRLQIFWKNEKRE